MTADVIAFPTPPQRESPRRPTDPQALEWRARMGALSENEDPCPGYRPGEWARVRAVILETLDRFGDELVRLGWTTPELFDAHEKRGVTPLDVRGALVLSEHLPTEITEKVMVRDEVTHHLRAVKRPGVPIWEYCWPEKKAPKPPEGWR